MRHPNAVALAVLMAACTGIPDGEGTSTTPTTAATTTTSSSATTLLDEVTSTLPEPEVVWTAAEAERHVENFLAALAAGAYEQAAFSATDNGVIAPGQTPDESVAEYFERMCAENACAGPYEVTADGPGLVDSTSKAASTVTVTHSLGGDTGKIALSTFEGELVIADLPPLVVSGPIPSLVSILFGDNPPARVVVQRFGAFEIWESGTTEWLTHGAADFAYAVEGDVVAASNLLVGDCRLASLSDPSITFSVACGPLMTRGGQVLVLTDVRENRWRLVSVTTGEEHEAPVAYESRQDGEYVWFTERGGTVLRGQGDAEGNLTELMSLDGVDLLGDGYASGEVLSTDGRHVAYVDHADPAAQSHFWSPVVVVRRVDDGTEVGRWFLENPVSCLEFGESWVVACEADDGFETGIAEQRALVAINIETDEVNRVDTRARVFLPG